MEIYAMTDYDGCDYITAGRFYKTIPGQSKYSFKITDDEGGNMYCLWDKCAHLKNGSWQRIEVGTLAELGVKPGDVVEFIEGAAGFSDYTKKYAGTHSIVNEYCGTKIQSDGSQGWFSECTHKFRIISRADQTSDAPKTWGEMTNAEKGALLLAAHEGKVIEWIGDLKPVKWRMCSAVGKYNDYAYRIKRS